MRRQTRPDVGPTIIGIVACLALCTAQPVMAAAPSADAIDVTAHAGNTTTISHWDIQTSAKAQQGGQAISRPGYATSGWHRVSAHATVMAGLLENGRYPDAFYGLNLQHIGRRHFRVPWWYRTTFQLSGTAKNLHTFLKINGIIPAADLWLNGKQVADRKTVAGAYTMHTFDITRLVHPGKNVLAIKVYPTNPQQDLALGWIDWNPASPDNNMGIWRNVDIVRAGPVSLRGLHVLSRLDLPGMQHADLTIKVRLRNHTAAAEDAVISGHVAGIALRRKVHLAAHEVRDLVFDPGNDPDLRLDQPKVWWPADMGAQPLYRVTMKARVDGKLSDRSSATFGIRDVRSRLTADGYRQFVINGQPLLIRGAGWAPDMFLRDRPERLAAEFRYIRNLGLNAIRSEGKLERPDFYRLADRNGILVLAGWECCDKWEAWAKTGGEPWNQADREIARASMASEAKRLRNHPSVIAFLIGSDNAPPAAVADAYVHALHAADWPNPIISAASAQKTQAAGPSGMKMSGPYGWVPPGYWYADKQGGAFGFNSETSAGPDIPRLQTLRAMLTPGALKALWSNFDARQYHAAPFWSPFSRLKPFDTALAHRYGAPKSLRDYVKKAQLANYATVRAQFEAYDARMDAAKPATGVIYWMLNNAWPSLHWHLIDYDLNPAGAYYGAKKANEPVHIQYAYDDRSIMAINHTLQPKHDLDARIRVYNLDGSVRYRKRLTGIDLPPNHATHLATIPALTALSGTYFVELQLTAADGHRISRNVYWLSSRPDVLDWTKSDWHTTPVSRYADLTALQQLPTVTLDADVRTRRGKGRGTTVVTLTAPATAQAVALFAHLSLRQSGNGKPLLPVTWSGNDVSLWPGQSITLTAHYPLAGQSPPVVHLSGWNVDSCNLPGS